MCAAPGGKLLILAGALLLAGRGARLIAVERDKFRFNRLQQNLELYLPPELLRNVQTLNTDASSPRTFVGMDSFDGILLDAPCSSERERLLRSKKAAGSDAAHVVYWDGSKGKTNAQRQTKLLRTALKLGDYSASSGKSECTVVYSTCALSRIENDNVVANALDRSQDWRHCEEPLQLDMRIAEQTSLGWRALPDYSDGWGPIYWSELRRAV
eukprot:TRINITY_DN30229_c0_g1_i2.p1 TRINITY_DN30229_c0_g1~~TRINITY_DN30229_c0_g1_i2.p1  ORF type:complete len:212 (-),score=46.36 TRINITY_DN30229_c0_g1_i2:43-678(-)